MTKSCPLLILALCALASSYNAKTSVAKATMFKCRLILLFHSREYTEFLDSAEISTQELDMRLACQAENHNVLTVSGFCTEEQAINYL